MAPSDTTQPRRSLTIGALVGALVEEFPDLTISKVRFLEAKGLLHPERRASGYRVFSGDDVARLRYILAAQRDRFWPLDVIKDALDAMDRGLTPTGPAEVSLPAVAEGEEPDAIQSLLTRPGTPVRLTAREIARAARIDQDTMDGLVGYGLLRADAEGHYDQDDLAVARAAGELAAYGLEARHLRPFRTAADRELSLVEQVRGPASRRSSDDPTPAILAACLSLHAALVRRGLTG